MDKSLKPSLLAIALIGAIATIPLHVLRSPQEWLAQAVLPATLSLTPQNSVTQGPENTAGPVTASLPPGRIALSNDGQLMVRGTESGQLEWLDGQGKVLQTISGAHQGAISAIVITPDGQTAISSGVDGTLRRWSRAGKPLGKAIPGRGGAIRALALSPDGQTLISGNQDGTIERWSVVDGTSLSPLIAADNSPIQAITYAGEGKNFFTGSGDGSLARWSPEGGLLKRVDGAHQGGITSIIASPYGKAITSGGSDGVVRSWDQATLLPQGKPIPAHSGAVTAMAYSPNGTTVATAGADKTLRLWGGDGVPLSSAPLTLNSPANFLGFTPDGQVVVGTADNRLEIRDGRGDVDVNSNPATPPPEADLWARLQALPPNTWWILLAVPVVLFLLGLLRSLFRTQGKSKPGSASLGNQTANETASTETPVQPLSGADMGIDFSGIGQQPSGGEGLSLPPEAALVPVAEVAVDSTTPGKLEQARSELVEGKRLMREQRYDLALIRFNSAIEATELERLKVSDSGAPMAGVNVIAAQAQAQRGNALLQMEQAAEAMESYNIALGFDTSNTEAWLGKGRLLTKLERYEEALFCFDSALEMDKTAIAAWSGKAEALMQLGRQAEAQTCIARVLSLGGEPPLPLPTGTGPITAGIVPDVPIDGINIPPDQSPSVSPGYDPDIPLELQRMVESLPSAEIGSPPLTLAIPPELVAAAAALPEQADVPPELVAAAAALPEQADVPPELVAAAAALPEQADVPPELVAAAAALPEQADVPPELAAAAAALPDQADYSTHDGVGSDQPLTPSPLSLEAELLRQVSLSVALPPAITDPLSPQALGLTSSPVAQTQEDVGPPSPVSDSPASSDGPSPSPLSLSWVKLSIDPDRPDRFYALWHIDDGDRTQARQQGGQLLAVRLYDVTGQATYTPLQSPVQEQRCHDDLAQDWYLPIPQWDRIYLAVVGYLGDGDAWYPIVQSTELAAISA